MRFAERQGLRLAVGPDPESFFALIAETAERHGFATQRHETYRQLLASPRVTQITAHAEGPAAVGIFLEFGGTVFYLFGATDAAQQRSMGSYLVLWEAIRLARRRGSNRFDFWGVAPPAPGTDLAAYEPDDGHPYASFSRFKRRFGGTAVAAPGTFDVVLSPLRYRLLRWLRGLPKLG